MAVVRRNAGDVRRQFTMVRKREKHTTGNVCIGRIRAAYSLRGPSRESQSCGCGAPDRFDERLRALDPVTNASANKGSSICLFATATIREPGQQLLNVSASFFASLRSE